MSYSDMKPEDLDAVRASIKEELAAEEARRSPGVSLIAAERLRQVTREGWTTEHDDGHPVGELMSAAECYVNAAMAVVTPDHPHAAAPVGAPVAPYWPWKPDAYKPHYEDAVPNLVKAGALIAAEIDRLIRERGATS
jgi:hypothetical protein